MECKWGKTRLVWGVVLSRVTSLVAAGLGFDLGSLFRQTPPCRDMASVVALLGGCWHAGRLHQTSHAGSAPCGGKVAILLVLELRFCACLGISEVLGGRI